MIREDLSGIFSEGLSKEVVPLFKMACRGESTVLITGATGTGKTSLARKIHEGSSRSSKPFVAINLATLHEGTLESELFGHERGAFTGAEQKRMGRLESAQGGTVFLDEVGELPLRLQARLLDFLQSQVISPLGSNREVRLDVRIIAATHRNLSEAVQKREFREDLFHRLRVVNISMKALKERTDEFDSILHSSLYEVCEKEGRQILRISSSAAEIFENYSWPGNIRELRNVLEYAVLASQNNEITHQDLPSWIFQSGVKTSLKSADSTPVSMAVLGVAEFPLTLNFQETLERFEKEYLYRALSRTGGRINRTAHQIGMNKATLIRRLRTYGLHPSMDPQASG